MKCVRLALEMEASKEGQRGVVRFLVAEGAGTSAIKSQRPVMLSDVILLHDNDLPHTANLVRDKFRRFGWETLQHPPYSPDLSLCDLHIFGDMKKDIRGVSFIRTRKFVDTSATNLFLQDWN